MTWCQAHSPLTSLTEKYKDEDLAAMKCFDFLFLLHLRDYQSESLCNLDDMIMQMFLTNLSRSTWYTKEFLQMQLHEKHCLIILDGLDEWTHSDKCNKTPAVPHNNHSDSCTVLSTTRSWKLGTIGLSENNIDRYIEISALDAEKRDQLEANAIRILNERKLNVSEKTKADFDEEFNTVQIGDIIYIPYILLQLMSLFFSGLPIGESKCEIFGNIIEFTLERGLIKNDLPYIHVQSAENTVVPTCMKENQACKRYFILLMKLGQLAFYTLFREKKESSLIFDRKKVMQYMNEQEIEFCLKVGLLCQTKDSSMMPVKRYQVFFQHKSVQDFFSAIFITSEGQSESVKSTILEVCLSLSCILEMEDVFVFVCGMNPRVYACLSGELQKIVDIDEVTRRYTCSINYGEEDDRTIRSYQSMQMQILQESMRNGNESYPIHLYVMIDRIIPNDTTSLESIIRFNNGHMKSLQLSSYQQNDIRDFMQLLDPVMFTDLETLGVHVGYMEPVWLADILTKSARTLQCLKLSLGFRIKSNDKHEYRRASVHSSLSDISIKALTGLACLQSLYLDQVRMTHNNLTCLYAYISQTTTLTELKLDAIDCSDHKDAYHDCDVNLDLTLLNELKVIHHFAVPCRDLHVNSACLEKFTFKPPFEEKTTSNDCVTFWQDLREAPVLSSLILSSMTSSQEMIQTISTLTQLMYIRLEEIDMGDVILNFTPAMTKLKHVELRKVQISAVAWKRLFINVGQLPQSITVELKCITMTSQEWKELLLSIADMQHPVSVVLSNCRGSSLDEWEMFIDEIKSTPTLSWILDLDLHFDGYKYDDDDYDESLSLSQLAHMSPLLHRLHD